MWYSAMDTFVRNRGLVAVRSCAATFMALAALGLPASVANATTYQSRAHDFRVVEIADGLRYPWGLAFLPNGELLVTERGGALRVVRDGAVSSPVAGLPEIWSRGQGGLLDIALHPQFVQNRWLYLSYARGDARGGNTELLRAKYEPDGHDEHGGGKLRDVQILFRATPNAYGGRHFGSRIRFLKDGSLLLTLGDRGERDHAQNLRNHAGSSIRLRDDGSVPSDNPFVAHPHAKPEIFTYGNRNIQGLAIDPVSGRIWAHEHGPQGGDELNILRRGNNYGWPTITYGRNYGIGTKIGEGTHKAGMQQPVIHWTPSIAPSGLDFYNGDAFPNWRGNLFVGALRYQLLVRLVLDESRRKVVAQERLLAGEFGRIRDVRSGPDGGLYLLTDSPNGKILVLRPE